MRGSAATRPSIEYAVWYTRWSGRALAAIGVVLGVAMILGGPRRFSGPGFAISRQVPGGVYTWGGLLALFGAVSLAGSIIRRRRMIYLGLLAVGCWHAFFALTFVVLLFRSSSAAVTGVVAYGGYSILTALAVAILHQDMADARRRG